MHNYTGTLAFCRADCPYGLKTTSLEPSNHQHYCQHQACLHTRQSAGWQESVSHSSSPRLFAGSMKDGIHTKDRTAYKHRIISTDSAWTPLNAPLIISRTFSSIPFSPLLTESCILGFVHFSLLANPINGITESAGLAYLTRSWNIPWVCAFSCARWNSDRDGETRFYPRLSVPCHGLCIVRF